MVPKVNDMKTWMEKHWFHILIISEVWLSFTIESVNLRINNYEIVIIEWEAKVIDLSDDIEQLFSEIAFNGLCFVIAVTYKLPNLSYNYFEDALESTLTNAMSHSKYVVCAEDVNVNFLNNNSPANVLILW